MAHAPNASNGKDRINDGQRQHPTVGPKADCGFRLYKTSTYIIMYGHLIKPRYYIISDKIQNIQNIRYVICDMCIGMLYI